MGIFQDFNDNVITPVVQDYNLYQSTQQQTTAAPTGTVGTGGVPNTNPQLFSGVNNNALIMIAVGVIALFIFLRK
jgi:hypothetical protein